MKIGDKVMLNIAKAYSWRVVPCEYNPVDTIGEVVYITAGRRFDKPLIRVSWSNGHFSEYHPIELCPANPIILEGEYIWPAQ